MTTYKLDLSTLSIQQMKDIIKILNPSCGHNYHSSNCDLCIACELECWHRKDRNDHTGIEIVSCG
jgi:hypothetical protein